MSFSPHWATERSPNPSALTLEGPLRGGEKESKMERINEGREKLGDERDGKKRPNPK